MSERWAARVLGMVEHLAVQGLQAIAGSALSTAALRLSAADRGAASEGLEGEPQAGLPAF